MKYRICWKSKQTGSTGQGEPVFSSREIAQTTADEFNKEYPDLEHWVEEVNDERPD